MLYVTNQYSYDEQHLHPEDLYRITSALQLPGDKHVNATVSPPTAPAMKRDFPEVTQFTRVVPSLGVSQYILHCNDKSWSEKSVVFVDSTFFEVFKYHFSRGVGSKALRNPYSIVLDKSIALKMFGEEDPLGKQIEMEYSYGKGLYTVQGVVDESLGKSHIKANIYITMNGGGMGSYARNNDSWAGNNFCYSYIRLVPNTNVAALESKLPSFLNKYGQDQLKQLGMKKQLHLQPVTSIHTTKGFENELDQTANPSFLNILMLIAALIQIIACINFMNLSTARSTLRAKEVGVRKAIGAGRSQLIRQFLTESVLLSAIGVMIALPLLWILMPYLNHMTRTDIPLSFLSDYRLWLMMSAITLVTGIFAGSYPALYLSAFEAIKVLKGNFTNQISAVGIRRSLVVFQFILAIVLISGIIVIYSQLNYIKHKDLGFDQNQKMVFTFHTNETMGKSQAFADDLRRLAEVKAASRASYYLSQSILNDWTFYLSGGDMASGQVTQFMVTDQYFTRANGIQIVQGRDFRMNDTGKVLINETMAHRLGLPLNKAEGTFLFTKQGDNQPIKYEIAGIMKDFNFNSLREELKPVLIMYNDKDPYLANITANTSTSDYSSFLSQVESIWQKHFPSLPFEYTFLDTEVQKMYESEITLSRIINGFTGMAIMISCLGLFGLAAFSAENRRKEIGIRKVLGAKIFSLTTLLSADFIRLVFIAIVIATPVSWWAMNKWLQSFNYRIILSWWMFTLAGAIALFIAIITVSTQAIKAAIENPVKSLRSE
jgi:putative ABC transport system permease protein